MVFSSREDRWVCRCDVVESLRPFVPHRDLDGRAQLIRYFFERKASPPAYQRCGSASKAENLALLPGGFWWFTWADGFSPVLFQSQHRQLLADPTTVPLRMPTTKSILA